MWRESPDDRTTGAGRPVEARANNSSRTMGDSSLGSGCGAGSEYRRAASPDRQARSPWGLCRRFQQGLGRGAEQDGVDQIGVLQRQAADLWRKRKHHVKIGRRQKLRLPLGEPLGAGRGLALRTVAIAARVVGDALVAAVQTAFDVSAQRCCATPRQIAPAASLRA